jgi:hypothetical protein
MEPKKNHQTRSTFALWLCHFLLISTHFALAQNPNEEKKSDEQSIKKGTKIIGAYLNFSTLNTTTVRAQGATTESAIQRLGGNVSAGKMTSDHWGLLLNLGYTSSNVTTPEAVNGVIYNRTNARRDFVITPSVRNYRYVTDEIYAFVQMSINMSVGSLTFDEFDNNNALVRYNFNTTGFGVGISPGLTYFVNKKLSTEVAIGVIGYSIYNGKDSLGNTTRATNFQSLFYQSSVDLGFVYYW